MIQRKLKLRYVGGTVVLTMPREALEVIGAKQGDIVNLTAEKGEIRITPETPRKRKPEKTATGR